MPIYNAPIEEIDEAVKRPMVATIAYDVVNRLALPQQLPMIFKGQAPQAQYLNSDISARYSQDNNRYEGEAYLTIDYEEEETEQTLLSTSVDRIEQKGFFIDTDLNVYMMPSYVNKRVTINFQLTGTEKQVERWRANMKRITAQGILDLVHCVPYHYPIPQRYMRLLVDIHKRRETVAPTGEALGDWFKRCFNGSMDVIRMLNGTRPLFVIRENQTPIQGWYDFGTAAPKKERDTELTRYVLNFSYTFHYDCPETVTMKTPLVIHNQLLPAEWLPLQKVMQLDFIQQYGTYSQEAFNHFRFAHSSNQYIELKYPGIPIPHFDDWVGDTPNTGYESMLRLLIQLNEADLTSVVDLTNLGEWTFSPAVLKYMRSTKSLLSSPYDNVFNLMLHQGDNLLDMAKMSVSDDLKVSFAEPLDITKVTHLNTTVLTNPDLLTLIGIDGLIDNACFFKQWIGTLYPDIALKYNWDLTACELGSVDDSMTSQDIQAIIAEAVQTDPNPQFWCLVGQFTIYARHRENFDGTDTGIIVNNTPNQ